MQILLVFYFNITLKSYGFNIYFLSLSENWNIMATLKVKQIAKQQGLTLAKLAEELGMHPVSLSATLSGNPTLTTLCRIAKVLNVQVADLFENENSHTTISGFVKVGSEIIEISTVEDLEKVLRKAKEIK